MFITSLAVLIRIFSNSMANVYQKQLTARGCTPALINFVMYCGLSILCVLLKFDNVCFEFGVQFWVSSILGGLFGAIGNFCLVKALEGGELSVLGPINAYKAVVAMVFGIFLLHEFPSAIGVVAVLLIILGSYFIFDTLDEGFSFNLLKRKDIRYRIYALVFTAIEAVFIKKVIELSDINIAFTMWAVWGAIFSGILLFVSPKKSFKNNACIMSKLGLIIIMMGVMQYSTNIVFARIPVSYGLALFQLSAILSVIFGWRFFRETHFCKKLLGSLIMVFGAVLLILFK